MIKFFNKKTIIVILIAAVLFSIAPKPASAGIFDSILTEAVEVLKQILVQKLVNQTVKWIQTGEEPKFVTNLPAFLQEAVDQAGGKFLETAIGPQICSPFRPTLKLALYPVATFNERTTCTLNQVVDNIEDTLGYFKSGDWIGWQTMVSNPQNNVYGAYVMAWDQYEIEKIAAAEASKSEVETGKGYLGIKKCVEWDDSILDPCNFQCSQTFQNPGAVVACEKSCEKSACTNWQTLTPGAAVGDAVTKAIGSKLDQVTNIQGLGAGIGMIATALVNKIFEKGVGLLGATPFSEESGIISSAESQCASLNVASSTPEMKAEYNYCLTHVPSGPSASTQCASLMGTADYATCMAAVQGGGGVCPSAQMVCGQLSDPGYDVCIKEAMPKCAPSCGKGSYYDCISAVKSGISIEEYKKKYALGQCSQFSGTVDPLMTEEKDYDNCMTFMQGDNPDIGKFREGYALKECAQFLGTADYSYCITHVEIRGNAVEFQKDTLVSLIKQELVYQTQLLLAKGATSIVLNQSTDILVKLLNCQASMPSSYLEKLKTTLTQVQNTASTTANQIIQIQSDIIALQTKQQEIEAITTVP
ncbi:MAG: hypothetical protein Q8N43_02830, partial [Candidatus Azambacteria bacterium]|nr:hypothetical protein [Candidatus Azambacteria bacterium]